MITKRTNGCLVEQTDSGLKLLSQSKAAKIVGNHFVGKLRWLRHNIKNAEWGVMDFNSGHWRGTLNPKEPPAPMVDFFIENSEPIGCSESYIAGVVKIIKGADLLK